MTERDTPNAESVCPCGHPWDEHDGMGDCHHLDGRTVTGYCQRCPHVAQIDGSGSGSKS